MFLKKLHKKTVIKLGHKKNVEVMNHYCFLVPPLHH